MNWEAIGAVGEIIGAAGVILTLGYLAVQIRHSSNAVRSSMRQAISTTQAEIGIQMAANPDLRGALIRWRAGEAPSSPDEELSIDMFLRSTARMWENQYHQHQDGTFDDAMWAGYVEVMKRSMAAPLAREFWERNRALYSSEFSEFIERQVLGGGHGGSAV